MGWQWLGNWQLNYYFATYLSIEEQEDSLSRHAKFSSLISSASSIDSQQINYFRVTLHKTRSCTDSPPKRNGMFVLTRRKVLLFILCRNAASHRHSLIWWAVTSSLSDFLIKLPTNTRIIRHLLQSVCVRINVAGGGEQSLLFASLTKTW